MLIAKSRNILFLLFMCITGFFCGKELYAAEDEKYPDMVRIPAGEFYMGENKYYEWVFMLAYNIYDGPEHIVYLDEYYIDKYEVTNEQYAKFIKETGRRIPISWFDSRFNQPKQPVVGIMWEDAVAYAKWVGKRLPTEAEWEKAARGTDRRLWPWGSEIFDAERCNVWEIKLLKTVPVGTYEKGKSPYGCYDMAGNAWEWCADWYDQNYYYYSPKNNPKGPEYGQQKVIRGGSWHYFGHFARCAARYRVPSFAQLTQIGFRCAKSVE